MPVVRKEKQNINPRPNESKIDEIRECVSDSTILDALLKFLPDDTIGEFIESEYPDFMEE